MYTVTSLPLDSRTRVIFRNAEFGFLGVIILTCEHTPRFCGQWSSTGALLNFRGGLRRLRTNWLMVGIGDLEITLNKRVTAEVGTYQPIGTSRSVKAPHSTAPD